MGMDKRAQVTLFMIIGFAIVGVVGYGMYVSTYSTEAKLDREVERIHSTGVVSESAIKYYVSLCLKSSTEDALYLMGKQGGAIYESQGGLVPDNETWAYAYSDLINFTYMTINESKIHYSAIIKPFHTSVNNSFAESPSSGRGLPYYPCECQMCDGDNELCRSPSGCPIDFENPCLFSNTTTPEHKFSHEFIYPRTNTNLSLKKQLESFISEKTKDCVELDNILHVNSTFDIVEGVPDVNVTITDNSVDASLQFPVYLKSEKQQRTINTLQYFTSIPVRLRSIHKRLRRATYEDNRDFSIDIKNIFDEILLGSDELGIMKMRKTDIVADENGPMVNQEVLQNDVFTITDYRSNLRGSPYNFTFVRQNRFPALNYIGKASKPQTLEDVPEVEYDFIMNQGDVLTFLPVGNDLDEDSLTYHYSGWRENYTDYFNYSEFYESNCNDYPANCTYKNKTSGLPGKQPKDWTNSDLYQNTEQYANYTLGNRDVGYHKVNITVCDGFWCDRQAARVLVLDIPHAEMKVYNWYSGIPNHTASVEDPYFVQMAQSHSYFGSPQTKLHDVKEETVVSGFPPEEGVLFHTAGTPPGLIYLLPERPRPWIYGGHGEPKILNVSGPFNNYGSPKAGFFTDHTLVLTVSNDVASTSFDSDSADVDVAQCIPYRAEYQNFPFHNVPMDDNIDMDEDADNPETPVNESNPLFANHTCCEDMGDGKGRYYETDQVCYQLLSHICGSPLNLSESIPPAKKGEYALQDVIPDVTPVDAPDFDYWNDFYLRNFTVKCDGKRGNICNGTHTDIFQQHTECDDLTSTEISQGYDERCTGCGSFTDIIGETEAGTCLNVPAGTTFENENKYYGLTDVNDEEPNGFCNDVPKCSDVTYNDVNTGEYNLYQATCDGSGECTDIIEYEDCISYSHEECRGDRYWYEKWGCTYQADLPENDTCTDSSVEDEIKWDDKACQALDSRGTNFCDDAPVDNNEDDDYPTPGHPLYNPDFYETHKQSCTNSECCNVDGSSNFRECFDPCVDTGKDDECYSSDPATSRECGGPSRSGDQCIGFTKENQCQLGSGTGNNDGYCNYENGNCTDDLLMHDKCETYAQCNSVEEPNDCVMEYDEGGVVTGGDKYCCNNSCVYAGDGADTCKGTGYRIDTAYYCDGEDWEDQIENGYHCSEAGKNDYECKDNNCVLLEHTGNTKCCAPQSSTCSGSGFDPVKDCTTHLCDEDSDCGDWVYNKSSGNDNGLYKLVNGYCQASTGDESCTCIYDKYTESTDNRRCFVKGFGVVDAGYVNTIAGEKKFCRGGHTWVTQYEDTQTCTEDFNCLSGECSGYPCAAEGCVLLESLPGSTKKCCSEVTSECSYTDFVNDCKSEPCDGDEDCGDYTYNDTYGLDKGTYLIVGGYCGVDTFDDVCECKYGADKKCYADGNVVGDGYVDIFEGQKKYCEDDVWRQQKSDAYSCDVDYECVSSNCAGDSCSNSACSELLFYHGEDDRCCQEASACSSDCEDVACDEDSDCSDWVYTVSSGVHKGQYKKINGHCYANTGLKECRCTGYEQKCYLKGSVVDDGTIDTDNQRYCNGGLWYEQKDDGESCNGPDYECKSNNCEHINDIGYVCNSAS